MKQFSPWQATLKNGGVKPIVQTKIKLIVIVNAHMHFLY